MLKQLLYLSICLALVLTLSSPVCGSVSHIADKAGLLSPQEIASLNETAEKISTEQDISVVILTTNSLHSISTWEYADQFFHNGDYGKDGILLLISIEYRDWEIATYGKAADRISNAQCDALFDAMADNLSRNQFYHGFKQYLQALDAALSKKTYAQNTGLQVIVSLGIGAITALVTILVMRWKMNTVRPQHNAGVYLKQGSFRLTERSDIYLYSNITKTRRANNTSSGGSGSRGGSRGKF